ncbi:MAG: carboxylating nicotinate-nucleotide diphosphorylase [Oscillospiraceae bacterium]|nr:carboxylating nicotinate-nucleotide diphosphorylase [Oscillospiraceae bacterium]
MILPKLSDFYTDDIIKRALFEDINYIDVTADLLIGKDNAGTARIVAKENGVLSGINIAARVFNIVDSSVTTEICINDGQTLYKGDLIAVIGGSVASILKAERTALNILQHMSGISTYTKKCVDMVSGTGVSVTDTRKTLPGLRGLQKYAVLCGGGRNHRFNLSSAAMIKDNHIDACGSISRAIATLKENVGHMVTIEVEVRDLQELQEAIDAGADVIMLDNMDVSMMRKAVNIVAKRAKLEASGNITLDNIRAIAETGIDIISLGALTHSVTALDISLLWDNQ